MIRKLLIVSAAGVAISVACIVGAAALVRHDLGEHGWNWTFAKSGDHIRFAKGSPGAAPVETTKTLTWGGGDLLSIATDADVEYVPGDTASVTVSGPQADVDRIRIDGGRIFSVGDPGHDQMVTVHFGTDSFDAQKNRGASRSSSPLPGSNVSKCRVRVI